MAEWLGRRTCNPASRSDRYLELFHGRPEFNSSATLVNSQLACLLSVGIFSPVMFSLKYLFLIFVCSAPLAYCYHHLTRVNKGHFFFFLFYVWCHVWVQRT